MKLVHYFVTKCNYAPIIVNGVQNEVWLENLDGPYRIIRINSNYIHNKEQFNTDLYKIKNVVKQIKKKTLSFNMNTLNIFLDLNNDVNLYNEKDISSVSIHKVNDIKNNSVIKEMFPDITTNLINDTKGIDLIINVTNDINKKTAEENKKYENTFKKKPIIVTNIIIVACIIMYALTYLRPNLVYILANQRGFVKEGQIWRLFTCMFVHGGILHLICNMYSLYVIGSQLETFLGKFKFIFVYFISGLVGSLLSLTFSTSYSIGASGAIFGLLGSLLYFGYHYRIYLGTVLRTQIIPIIIINLALGFSINNIDNFAHIGGLIGGYLSTMAIGLENKSTKEEKLNGWIVLTLLILFLAIFTIIR